MYAIYDLKENEQCIAIFDTRIQVAEYFNTTANTIRNSNKKKTQERWQIFNRESRGVKI